MTIENLKELFVDFLSYIVRFGFNFISFLLQPLFNLLSIHLPRIDGVSTMLQNVFDFATPYINFILDITFISSPILAYLVISLIGRIVLRSSSYTTKVILQWYEKIVP